MMGKADEYGRKSAEQFVCDDVILLCPDYADTNCNCVSTSHTEPRIDTATIHESLKKLMSKGCNCTNVSFLILQVYCGSLSCSP